VTPDRNVVICQTILWQLQFLSNSFAIQALASATPVATHAGQATNSPQSQREFALKVRGQNWKELYLVPNFETFIKKSANLH
jgi:hypothetical protein